MKTSTWKVVEKAVARYLGGDRNPITGRTRNQGVPDIGKSKQTLDLLPDGEDYLEHSGYKDVLAGCIFEQYTFEVKHRKSLPKWLKTLQLEASDSKLFLKYENCVLTTLYNFRDSFFSEKQEKDMTAELELPEWIKDAYDQALKTGNTPYYVVILHGKNQKMKDSLVLIFGGEDGRHCI